MGFIVRFVDGMMDGMGWDINRSALMEFGHIWYGNTLHVVERASDGCMGNVDQDGRYVRCKIYTNV